MSPNPTMRQRQRLLLASAALERRLRAQRRSDLQIARRRLLALRRDHPEYDWVTL